jgi:hypothetical protein
VHPQKQGPIGPLELLLSAPFLLQKSPAEARLEVCHAKAGTEHIPPSILLAYVSYALADLTRTGLSVPANCLTTAFSQRLSAAADAELMRRTT